MNLTEYNALIQAGYEAMFGNPGLYRERIDAVILDMRMAELTVRSSPLTSQAKLWHRIDQVRAASAVLQRAIAESEGDEQDALRLALEARAKAMGAVLESISHLAELEAQSDPMPPPMTEDDEKLWNEWMSKWVDARG